MGGEEGGGEGGEEGFRLWRGGGVEDGFPGRGGLGEDGELTADEEDGGEEERGRG